MRSHDQELDERTVSALLVSVEAAAEIATSLPEPERAEIAARITEQAELLEQLRQFARRAQQAEALQAASGQAFRAAERAGAGPISPTPQPAGPLHEPTRNSSATPHGTLTPTRTPSPRFCHRDRVAHACAFSQPKPRSTAQSRQTAGDTSGAAHRPRLGGIPRRQRLWDLVRLRPPSPAPAATSPGPGPAATSPGPGPAATSPGPGPAATSPGPDPAATSPGPRPTSPDPGSGSPPVHSPGPRG